VNLLPTRRDMPYMAVIVAVLSTLLLYPLNDDNGHWQSMALELLRYGKWPYVGTWDQNFPGIILFHIAAIALFGPSDLGFRLFDLILQIGFCWMLYHLWRRWLTEREAWVAIMIYAFCYVRSAPFVAGQRDMFAAMIVVMIAGILIRERLRTPLNVFWLGLVAGIAVLIRPTFEEYLLLIALFSPLRKQRFDAIVFVVAGLIPLALSFAMYSFWPGAFDQYWTATVRFNLDTYAQIARPFAAFFKGVVSPKLLSIPAVIGAYLLLRKKRIIILSPGTTVLYFSMIVLTIIFVLLQRKYYPYHFAPNLILLTPLAGIGVERMLRPIPTRWQIPLVVLVFFVSSLPYEALVRHRSEIRTSVPEWIASSYADVYWHDPAEPSIINYIRSHTSDSDRIEVCSFDPRIRLHLLRQPVGKYASLHPLGFLKNRNDPNSLTDYQREWMREYVDTLAVVRPKYIVMVRASVAEYLHDPYATVLSRSAEFMQMLGAYYRLDTTIIDDDIYVRK
jgi:hypothetical protein